MKNIQRAAGFVSALTAESLRQSMCVCVCVLEICNGERSLCLVHFHLQTKLKSLQSLNPVWLVCFP